MRGSDQKSPQSPTKSCHLPYGSCHLSRGCGLLFAGCNNHPRQAGGSATQRYPRGIAAIRPATINLHDTRSSTHEGFNKTRIAYVAARDGAGRAGGDFAAGRCARVLDGRRLEWQRQHHAVGERKLARRRTRQGVAVGKERGIDRHRRCQCHGYHAGLGWRADRRWQFELRPRRPLPDAVQVPHRTGHLQTGHRCTDPRQGLVRLGAE